MWRRDFLFYSILIFSIEEEKRKAAEYKKNNEPPPLVPKVGMGRKKDIEGRRLTYYLEERTPQVSPTLPMSIFSELGL